MLRRARVSDLGSRASYDRGFDRPANVTCATRNDALTATRGSRWKVRLDRLARPIRELGWYAAIALILPGGNLIALSLWMLRHRTWLATRARQGLSAVWTAGVRLIFPR